MMKSLRLIFASTIVIGGFSILSFAQTDAEKKPVGINDRQENQQNRIYDGVQDNELNKREFFRLQREQAQIRRQEARFRSDGEFTKLERARVQRNLNQSSRNIYQEKHDQPANINDRQQNQQKRIFDGVQDRELNKKEFFRLEKEQTQIRRQEKRFRSDGEFTKGERAKVQRNLNQSSRHIKRAKNN